MSRAVCIDETVELVTEFCAKNAIGISVIEPLESGGTRVVTNNSADADTVRHRMKSKIIDGPVVRSRLHAWRAGAPFR